VIAEHSLVSKYIHTKNVTYIEGLSVTTGEGCIKTYKFFWHRLGREERRLMCFGDGDMGILQLVVSVREFSARSLESVFLKRVLFLQQ
jgi:hypothetical protein